MITVVTPCYNQARYLATAIASVLAQTINDFEYLLIDDGSTDDTWLIMQQWAKMDDRIRCIKLEKQPNVGVVLNRSIREAIGEYWVWCPSDDRLSANCLERKLQFSQNHPEAIIYSDGEVIDASGNIKGKRLTQPCTAKEFAKLVWKKAPIGFTGIWIPIKAFDIIGNFPTHLQFSEDFAWMIRATMHIEFLGISEFLYQKRVHPNRLTSKNQDCIVKQMPKIWDSLKMYQKLLGGTQ